MAGLEQLEIHSRSYLVRWIEVAVGHTISWSIQPHKRSITFGIFKHPGNPNGPAAAAASLDSPNLPSSEPALTGLRHASAPAITPPVPPIRQDGTSAKDKLQSLGMKVVDWAGRCEADQVSTGRYNVLEGESGMYGLVFDNTHSKQFSKTVTFVLMTYPTKAPPKSGHQMHFKQAMARSSSTSLGNSPMLRPAAHDSNELLPQDLSFSKISKVDSRSRSNYAIEWDTSDGATFYTGVLSKKRRKRNQGWAKRFFSLDFTSSTLSYYRSRSSAALRGAIPLYMAAIGADEKSKHISIDSGAEVWLLRAQSAKDFAGWRDALERAAERTSTFAETTIEPSDAQETSSSTLTGPPRWESVEPLVGRVAGITDSVRRLTQDTDPKRFEGLGGLAIKDAFGSGSPTPSPTEHEAADYFATQDRTTRAGRPSFWRRKSGGSNPSPSGLFKRSDSGQRVPTSSSLTVPSPSPGPLNIPKRQGRTTTSAQVGSDVHDRCNAILKDLDAVVAEFSSLIAQSRQMRMPERPVPTSRNSLESTISQEYFDANEGLNRSHSQLLKIHRDSEADASPERDWVSIDSASTIDDMDEGESNFMRTPLSADQGIVPRPKALTPLPRGPVTRRASVPLSSGSPPSLISFLRKNVGKDLSTIAMPVTANEPLSLLQREAEQLEYSELLDSAADASSSSGERLLYISAFAVSALSNARLKERAIRKPFNPMLGETYELVREDKGFRFLAEKISHRPVRVACQAESKDWTFLHAPSPSQKFWGKSAELITEGRVRVFIHSKATDPIGSNDECYSWTPATCFLRNIIAGDKYVEPVQNMTVFEESTGRKAVVTFKSGGVFSGRSEDVTVEAFDANGSALPLSLTGKWTESLTLTSSSHSHAIGTGTVIWKVGPLVQDAPKRYGMTEFAATLNEITALEKEDGMTVLPPTDSRRRPDQRAYEEGKIDKAESLKIQLEEAQRRRRKEMETSGETWEPRWFEEVDGEGAEDIWRLKGERDGEDYWGVRAAVIGFKGGKWDGVREVFEL